MRVLIGCEFSGRVRRAFREMGVDAWSCDLDPSADLSTYHLQCDIFEAIAMKPWDMMIVFPPCTYLTIAGNRWHKNSPERAEAVEFVRKLWKSDIKHIAIENPVGVLSTKMRPPSQIIHPWQFGHSETKRTCLWLKNLPLLQPTKIVDKGVSEIVRYSGDYGNSQKVRSLTYLGIAEAMSNQWHPSEIQKHLSLLEQNSLVQSPKS